MCNFYANHLKRPPFSLFFPLKSEQQEKSSQIMFVVYEWILLCGKYMALGSDCSVLSIEYPDAGVLFLDTVQSAGTQQ